MMHQRSKTSQVPALTVITVTLVVLRRSVTAEHHGASRGGFGRET